MGLGYIDTVFRPWTGEVQVHLPTPAEKADIGLPDQTPDHAIHGRWYVATIKKREDIFRPQADGSFRDGNLVIRRVDDHRLSITRGGVFGGDVTIRSRGGKYRCYSKSRERYITYWIDRAGSLHKKSSVKDILDSVTGKLYRPDFTNIIRAKCFLSLFGNPLHMVGAMAVNLCMTLIDPVLLPVQAGIDLVQDLYDLNNDAWANFRQRIIEEIPLELVQNIWNIFRCVIYAVPIEIVLLYGMAYPLEARAKVGELERLWKYPYTFREDALRHFDDDYERKTFFLDWCFQEICNIYEKDEEGHYPVHIEKIEPVLSNPPAGRTLIQ